MEFVKVLSLIFTYLDFLIWNFISCPPIDNVEISETRDFV